MPTSLDRRPLDPAGSSVSASAAGNVGERWRTYAAAAVVITVAAALVEWFMGRLPLCQCGYVKLWHGVVYSSENSQHLSDWYTFTHVLHGLGFYFLLWLAGNRFDVGLRFVVAVALEAAWEVAENTPFIIDRYRAATISFDYYGDSIVNSIADIVAMAIGFLFAAVLNVWASAALFLVVEAGLALMIRDSLLLNILMLIHPIEAIRRWQMGG